MKAGLNSRNADNLIKAILELKNGKEARKFLRDLLTEKEIQEFGNRWKAAQMLWNGKPYMEIRKETGLSERTIARISKWLKRGTGGYRLILKRINSHHPDSSRKRSVMIG